jgi:magnesium-transporting ATPase (P-type)
MNKGGSDQDAKARKQVHQDGASSNFGNMFSVLGASLFLPFLPMAPIQVLTNNLLYDFSQTAIPTDNVDDDYLAAPRRWDIDNIFKFMVFMVLSARSSTAQRTQ